MVKLVRPCHLRVNAEVEIPDFADSSACVRLARAVAALTSAATASLSLVSLIQVSYSYNGTDATLLCRVSLFRHAWGMTRTPLTGPATAYIAGELRAQRARKGWALDDLQALTGVARSTINRALSGDGSISVEVLIQLCAGMGLDVVSLVNEAADMQ